MVVGFISDRYFMNNRKKINNALNEYVVWGIEPLDIRRYIDDNGEYFLGKLDIPVTDTNMAELKQCVVHIVGFLLDNPKTDKTGDMFQVEKNFFRFLEKYWAGK